MIYLCDNIAEFDFAAALTAVSEQRRCHALRYRQEHDQRLSVAAYRLLQQALQEEYGIGEPPVFAYDIHGKPSLVGHNDIFFSMSHCREAAACAISHFPIGIDVESLDSYDAEMVPLVMNAEEQRQIACSSDKRHPFITLWTKKESLLKLTGEATTDDIRLMLEAYPEIEDVDSAKENTPRETTFPFSFQEQTYCFRTTVFPQFVCTVCHHTAEKDMGNIKQIRL